MESLTSNSPDDDVRNRRETPRTTLRRSDYLSVKPVIDWLRETAPQYAHGTLVDYGCGNKPYLSFFKDRIDRYVGIDVVQNLHNTVDIVVGPGDPLPIQDNSIDTIISTQVLEHVAEPKQYLQEAARILHPGGHLILTCPGAYMLHEEPYDFYRYTEHGLRYLLSTAGLQLVRIDTAGGAWRVIGQTILNHKTFGRRWHVPIISDVVYNITTISVNVLCAVLDRLNVNVKDTSNYMIIAQK